VVGAPDGQKRSLFLGRIPCFSRAFMKVGGFWRYFLEPTVDFRYAGSLGAKDSAHAVKLAWARGIASVNGSSFSLKVLPRFVTPDECRVEELEN